MPSALPTLSPYRMQHLRHLASIIFEARQFSVHEGTQHNTRQLVALHDTHAQVAATLRLIMLLFAGILAFAVLDRLTGSWTVMDTAWFEDFAKPMIKNSPVSSAGPRVKVPARSGRTPGRSRRTAAAPAYPCSPSARPPNPSSSPHHSPQLVWFLVNMTFWASIAGLALRALALVNYTSQGTIIVRVRVMQRLMLDRFALYLASKNTTAEERSYDHGNALVRQSWTEVARSAEFGGAPPRVTVEYDKSTGFMHSVTVEYARRAAKR